MVWPIVLPLALAVAALVVGAVVAGARRWERQTRILQSRLLATSRPPQQTVVDFRLLEGLPAPVQLYFRSVLREGQPVIVAARIAHEGTFNLSTSREQWKPFTSRQSIVTNPPGFLWDGRVVVAPGIPFRVHDAYVAGEGMLHPAALGLVSVMKVHGTRELAQGELMRWLAEAVFVPTALLPGPAVTWKAVDDHFADVTVVNGPISATLRFGFTAEGWVESVMAEARGRMVDGKPVPTPWRGRWWRYEQRCGIRVPTEGEVAWVLPEGVKPYWRGRLVAMELEFAAR